METFLSSAVRRRKVKGFIPTWTLRLKSYRAHWSWDGTFCDKIPNSHALLSLQWLVQVCCVHTPADIHTSTHYAQVQCLWRGATVLLDLSKYTNISQLPKGNIDKDPWCISTEPPLQICAVSMSVLMRDLQWLKPWVFCVHCRTLLETYPSILTTRELSRALFCPRLTLWRERCVFQEHKDDVLLLVCLGSYSLFWYCFRDHNRGESENWDHLCWRKFYRQMALLSGHVSVVSSVISMCRLLTTWSSL